MSRIPFPVVCLIALCLNGCVSVGEKFNSVLASNAAAAAVVDGRILQGQASFTSEREATVLLQSVAEPSLTCFGPLRYSASSAGSVFLTCNNGLSVTVAFRSLSALSGQGRGLLGRSEFSLTYGLEPLQAAAFLGVAPERLIPPAGTAPASGIDR